MTHLLIGYIVLNCNSINFSLHVSIIMIIIPHSIINWGELYWTPQKIAKVYKILCISTYAIIKKQSKLPKTAVPIDDVIIWSNPTHLKKS